MEVCGYEYWSVLDNLEAKFRYTRLYAMAVPDHEAPPRPSMASDWLHHGAFADAAVPEAGRATGLSLVPAAPRAEGSETP